MPLTETFQWLPSLQGKAQVSDHEILDTLWSGPIHIFSHTSSTSNIIFQ